MEPALKNPFKPEPKVSYKVGVMTSHKVRLFDPKEYQIFHSGKTHDRYNCPYCLEVRGKADDDAKFYWSRQKSIGYCFKCETVGVLETDKDRSELHYQALINSFNTSEEVIDYTFSSINYNNMFPELDEEATNYLKSRVPFYPQLKSLNLRHEPGYGITFPIRYLDDYIGYAIRIYNPKNKMKYYIPDGNKFLYSPDNALRSNNKFQEFTIVEGPFDAIAACLLGFPNPIAIQGKYITPRQIYQLRSMIPSRLIIFLDETELSKNLRDSLEGKLPTLQRIDIEPANMDPEERLIKIMMGKPDQQWLERLLSQVNRLSNDTYGALNDYERVRNTNGREENNQSFVRV